MIASSGGSERSAPGRGSSEPDSSSASSLEETSSIGSTESCLTSTASSSPEIGVSVSIGIGDEKVEAGGPEKVPTLFQSVREWFNWSWTEPPASALALVIPTQHSRKIPEPRTPTMTLSGSLLGRTSQSNQISYAKLCQENDPMAIEKANLLSILKLVIKEVIESSMKYAQQLDSDFLPVQHFFIVMEHILRHGFKDKKVLLGHKKDLWDLLQLVEKYDSEAADISASAKELPTVKTSLGRSRAWLRLALMQKKFCDYFNVLVNMSNEILDTFYESRSIMRSEEAIIIGGLLVSLNVVDCNLCLKEEDLDHDHGVIDFTLYLKTNKDTLPKDPLESSEAKLIALLDQKNYIEELNRRLNITVGNLQLKVDCLSTTSSTLKMDLANVQQSLESSEEMNKTLQTQLEKSLIISEPDVSKIQNESSLSSKESKSFKLKNENRKLEDLEKELKEQRSLKIEMEVAMTLMEKSVCEKQDTIVALRDQLECVKGINLEMQAKLKECLKTLKQRDDLVSHLEEKCRGLADILVKLDEKYQASVDERKTYQKDYLTAKNDLVEVTSLMVKNEKDLKEEKEWRQELQKVAATDKKEMEKLREELMYLQKIALEYNTLKIEHLNLKRQVQENETTMVELGTQLSLSKLQVDSLQENSQVSTSNSWMNDSEVNNCQLCEKEFNLSRRKHHCRSCGGIFCDRCSENKIPLVPSSRAVRVCLSCHTKLIT